jgi:peptidoglycan L-alanyl-D-glutamate endopeptidase CwlK
MYKLSKTSRSRIEGIEPVLIDIIETAIKDSPFDFGIPKFGGMRTDEEQEEMFAQGRTKPGRIVTWTLNSYHKSGKAFDIYAYVGGAKWDMKYLEPIARHLQKVALEQFCIELEWGFDLWGKDGAHFQIK